MTPRDLRNAPEPELRPVTTYTLYGHHSGQQQHLGVADEAHVAAFLAALQAAMPGWQIEATPETHRRWISPADTYLRSAPVRPRKEEA